jgi:hypothetical protein
MKRNILFGSVLAAALSVGLAAQAPTGAPQDPTAPPSSPRPAPSAQAPSAKDDSSSKSVTVTGCLQADSASATGTSGAGAPGAPAGGAAAGGAASSSKSESFILANASEGSGSSSGAGAAGGAAGTAGSASKSSASQYKLTGGSKSDLTKFVNSKVEIKGKLDSAGGAMSSSSSGPTLHVDSVKQISPSCTQ